MDELLSLTGIKLFSDIFILMKRGVEKMEDTSAEAAESGSKSVRIQVMVEVVLLAHEKDLVGGECDTNCGVEACAKLVSASDDTHKSNNNAHSGANSNAITSSVLTFNHEDDGDEDESADNLVNDDVEVHGEVELVTDIVGAISCWVIRSEDSNFGIWIIVETGPCEGNGEETTTDLSNHNESHEEEVFSILLAAHEDTDCDSRVEVSTGDITPDDDTSEE